MAKLSTNTRIVLGLVIFVVAYGLSIWLYVSSGINHRHQISTGAQSNDVTKVTVDIEEVKSSSSDLILNISVIPGPALMEGGTLKEDLSMTANSAVQANKRTWPKGTVPRVLRVSISLTGEIANWPLDRYETGPINVQLLSGPAQVAEPSVVTLVDRLLGWEIDVSRVSNSDPNSAYRLSLHRSWGTAAFGVVILGVLITLAGLSLFVAIKTVRNKRKFQPPMTTWYAAMLFAVMPLRNALPDSPPFGSWMDITVVLWVIVVLTISLVLYIVCWWRHLAPDYDKPAQPDPNPVEASST